MDRKIKNRLYTNNTPRRILRVIDDNSGEYHDIYISSGTNDKQRAAIADHAHILAGEHIDRNSKKFPWTRIVLVTGSKTRTFSKDEANGEGAVGHPKKCMVDKKFIQHDVDDKTFEIIPPQS